MKNMLQVDGGSKVTNGTDTLPQVRLIVQEGNPWFSYDDVKNVLDADDTVIDENAGDDVRHACVEIECSVVCMPFISKESFYDLMLKDDSPQGDRCLRIISHAVSDYFDAMEERKGLAPGSIMLTALSGDFDTANKMIRRPKYDSPKRVPLTADSPKKWLMNALSACGIPTTPDDLNDLAFIRKAMSMMQILIAGVDVTPLSLLGRLAEAIGCEFLLIDTDWVEWEDPE